MPATLGAWMEWKQVCNLYGCCERTQKELSGFAANRFEAKLEKTGLLKASKKGGLVLDSAALKSLFNLDDSWHYFEAHSVAGRMRNGKSYKDWLFDRLKTHQGTPEDVLSSGATLLLRTVVRDLVAKEAPESEMWGYTSMDKPLDSDNDESPGTLADVLLPDQPVLAPEEEADYTAIAHPLASRRFTAMLHRERVSMLCDALDLSLAAPEAIQLAGCAKSQLYAALRTQTRAMEQEIDDAYAVERPDSRVCLKFFTHRILCELALAWGRSEKKCQTLFHKAGVHF